MPLMFPHGVVTNTRCERLRMIGAKVVLEELRLHSVLFFDSGIGGAMFVQRKEWINIKFAAVGKGPDHDLLNIVEILVSAERSITGSGVKPAAPYQHGYPRGFDLRAQAEWRNLAEVDRPVGRLNTVVTELRQAQTV